MMMQLVPIHVRDIRGGRSFVVGKSEPKQVATDVGVSNTGNHIEVSQL